MRRPSRVDPGKAGCTLDNPPVQTLHALDHPKHVPVGGPGGGLSEVGRINEQVEVSQSVTHYSFFQLRGSTGSVGTDHPYQHYTLSNTSFHTCSGSSFALFSYSFGIIYYSPNCTRPVVIPPCPVFFPDPFPQSVSIHLCSNNLYMLWIIRSM
jgi:hypothetical protein